MANTLTGLIPTIYEALDVVSREMVGFIPAVAMDASAERAALNQTIMTPIAPAASANDITPGVYAPDTGDQSIGNAVVTISKAKAVPFRWTGEEIRGLNSNGPGYQNLQRDQIAQALRTLVNLIEVDLGNLYVGASRATGTAGTTPFGTAGDLSNIANARKILEDNGAPLSDLQLVLSTTAAASLRGKQNVLFKVNESGTDTLLRDGTLGQLEGFRVGVSAGVASVTKGTGASYVTSGSSASGTDAVALVTGTGTVLAGDVVTFAADANNQYVVGTGIAAPGTIQLNNPGLRMTIPTANAMTIGGSYTANLAFSRNAFALVVRQPVAPPEGDMADDRTSVTDPVTGITFEFAMYKQYRRVHYEVGIAWGAAAIKPEHAAIILG